MKRKILAFLAGVLGFTGASFAVPFLVKYQQSGNSYSYTAYSQYCPYGCSGSTTLSPSSYPKVYTAPEGTFFLSNGFLVGFGNNNVYLGKPSNSPNSSLSGTYYGMVVVNGQASPAQMTVNSGSMQINSYQGSYTGMSDGDFLYNFSGCQMRFSQAANGIWEGVSTTQGCDAFGVFLSPSQAGTNYDGEYLVYAWTNNFAYGPYPYKAVLQNGQAQIFSCQGTQCTQLVAQGTYQACSGVPSCVQIQAGNINVQLMMSQTGEVLGIGSHVVIGSQTFQYSPPNSGSGSGSVGSGSGGSSGGSPSGGSSGSSGGSGSGSSPTDPYQQILSTLNTVVNTLQSIVSNLIQLLSNLITAMLSNFNFPPQIQSFSASPTTGSAPLSVNFAWQISDPNSGDTLTCTVDFGDGNTQTINNCTSSSTASHQYANSGTYNAKLTVIDSHGASTQSNTVQIQVQ